MIIDPSAAIDYVMRREGGLEDDPSDPGGITNFGISLRFLKSLSSIALKKYGLPCELVNEEDIRNLTEEQAKAIYLGEFWAKAPFERLPNQNIANFLFDAAVNMGLSPAIKCAQRACWAVLKKKDAIPEDGILGDKTLELINQCAFYLLPAIRSERAGSYRLIASANPNERGDLNGWLNRSYTGV